MLNLPETEKEYYLLVNMEELLDRAHELGYDNAVIVGDEGLTDGDIENIKKNNKAVAMVLCPYECELSGILNAQLKEAGISFQRNKYKFLDDDEENGIDVYNDIDRIDLAITHFPSEIEMEANLRARRVIKITNYKSYCGNCHEYMAPDENYCKNCGTKRGEGAFEPFFDDMRAAYGPPVKVKTKCLSCGHIWATSSLGGYRSNFCPNCGSSKIKILREEVFTFARALTGCTDPFDEDERPVLLEKEEIIKLLDLRDEIDKKQWIDDGELLAEMKKAGIEVPEKADYESITDFVGEKMNLTEKILYLEGEDMGAYKGKACPNCKREYLAAIEYPVYSKDKKEELPGTVHNKGNGHELIMTSWTSFSPDDDITEEKYPSLLCLSCGIMFGKLKYRKKLTARILKHKR